MKDTMSTKQKTPKAKPKAAQTAASRKPQTEYTADLADRIIDQIIDGKTLKAIAKINGMPSRTMILKWRREFPEFGQLYDYAEDARADADADEVDEYARMIVDGKLDFNAGRVVIDAKKWSCAHRAPRRYGTKVSAEISGKDGGPIHLLSDTNENEMGRRLAFVLGKVLERKKAAEKEALPAPVETEPEEAERRGSDVDNA
jgi:transposase-like protein